jgi:hypothetical protein
MGWSNPEIDTNRDDGDGDDDADGDDDDDEIKLSYSRLLAYCPHIWPKIGTPKSGPKLSRVDTSGGQIPLDMIYGHGLLKGK